MVMLDGSEVLQQNICRYYASTAGGELIKIMPPISEDKEERRINVASDQKVWVCNNIKDFDRSDLDYNYYVSAAEKLVVR